MRNAANWCMFHVEHLWNTYGHFGCGGMFHVEQCLLLEHESDKNPTST
jgi:hypothetical protein